MWPAIGAFASALGGLFSSNAQKQASEEASRDRLAATNAAIGAQQTNFNNGLNFAQNQFDTQRAFQGGLLSQAGGFGANQLNALQNMFAPYVGAGNQALQGQQALTGLLGPDAQANAISGIANGPEMSGLFKQGEDAILQNASATGGLRGGNVQAALAQFRPQILSQLINQQYSRLGGLSALGQSSANSQASGGLDVFGRQLGLAGQVGANVAGSANQFATNAGNAFSGFGSGLTDLLGQQGAIGASNALAQGQANAGLFNGIGGALNLYGQQQGANANMQQLLQMLQQRGGLAGIGGSGGGFGGGGYGAAPAPSLSFGGNYSPTSFANSFFGGGFS